MTAQPQLTEREEVEKEKLILIKLLNSILKYDKDIGDINSRRGQYQKG